MDDELRVHFMRVHSAINAHRDDLVKAKIDFKDIDLDRFDEFFADIYRINVNDCGKLMDIDKELGQFGKYPSLTDLFDKAFYGR